MSDRERKREGSMGFGCHANIIPTFKGLEKARNVGKMILQTLTNLCGK